MTSYTPNIASDFGFQAQPPSAERKVATNSKRPAPFSIRLSPAERAQLESEADSEPIGSYIKRKTFGRLAPGRGLPSPIMRLRPKSSPCLVNRELPTIPANSLLRPIWASLNQRPKIRRNSPFAGQASQRCAGF